ncbi:MAG: ABC transporter ATP-binding protein [Janthinobacterium lividum]
MNARPLLSADDITKSFPVRRSLRAVLSGAPPLAVRALNGASLSVRHGETLAIVGESGCGKSTLARAIVRLMDVDSGQIDFDGADVLRLGGRHLRDYNRYVQMVFQDPYGSLNPRRTVGEALTEAISVHRLMPKAEIPARIASLLDLVRLPATALGRLPHEFSGGQRQRIAIARALSVEPRVLVADEIVSALDVSVQAQIINLLLELQERLGLSILFVSHDLRVVRHIAHRVAVMYLGRVVENGTAQAVFDTPRHPYTRALMRAAPKLRGGRRSTTAEVPGELPSPLKIPSGCPFHPRCSMVQHRCTVDLPLSRVIEDDHFSACHFAEAVTA